MTEQQAHDANLAAIRKILANRKSLTSAMIDKLIALGVYVAIYPRKGVAVINGFQRYELLK